MPNQNVMNKIQRKQSRESREKIVSKKGKQRKDERRA
jgi:hypothetical protein